MLQNLLEQGSFQNLFENHPDGICVIDSKSQFIYINSALVNMLGYTKNELLQLSLNQLEKTNGERGSDKYNSRLELVHKEGDTITVRLTDLPLIMDGEELGKFLRVEQVEQQTELTDIRDIISLISEKSHDVISTISAEGLFTYITPNVKSVLGYTPEEVVGKPATFFNHPDTNKKLLEHRSELVMSQDTVRFISQVRHKNGEYRWYETTANYIRDDSGQIIQTIGLGRDITESKETEAKMTHLAYHDSVTNLPNRRQFISRVNLILEQNKCDSHGLMVIDLNGFKYVNDTFGHDIGDLLLIEVGRRLADAVGEKGLVARWGGDEFTAFRMSAEEEELASLVERIDDLIAQPIVILGNELSVTASIGVSISSPGETLEDLIKKADTAMYQNKKNK
ncbi:diguanylate cyclase domain-containing protein [Bacillus sp. AK128]